MKPAAFLGFDEVRYDVARAAGDDGGGNALGKVLVVAEADGFEALIAREGWREAADERSAFLDDAIGLAVGVLADHAVFRLWRVARDAGQSQRAAVGGAEMARGVDDPDRVFGRGAIEVLSRRMSL